MNVSRFQCEVVFERSKGLFRHYNLGIRPARRLDP
jgi:hypothetical protein